MTNDALFLAFFVALIITLFAARVAIKHYKKTQLEKLYSQPLPAEWVPLLEQHVALYRTLPSQLKHQLHGHINYFLNTKIIAGCDGMEIDDAVRLTIAGNACILALQLPKPIFPTFETILVYPGTYVAKRVTHKDSVRTEHEHTMAGESWYRGPVVLSWDSVIRGSLNPKDGHNVVMHEFVHKLDEQSGAVNGLPVLRDHDQFDNWVEVLNNEYSEFLQRVELNINRIIDEYGSVSPPEFFAVASESFFEKSVSMKRKLPTLYEQLENYYRLDPASW